MLEVGILAWVSSALEMQIRDLKKMERKQK